MLPNFTRHLSPMPRLHSVTLGIDCPRCSLGTCLWHLPPSPQPPHSQKKSKKPRAPGTQKPREKLLTFQRHSVDFSHDKTPAALLRHNYKYLLKQKRIMHKTCVVTQTTVQHDLVTKGNRQGTRPSTPSQKTLCPTEVGFQTP